MFGTTTTQSNLFGTPAATTMGTSLFGSTKPSLFGSSTTTTSTVPTLFASSTAQPSLFGTATTAAPASGIFGTGTSTSSTGGIFSAATTSAAPATSVFNNATTSSGATVTTGLGGLVPASSGGVGAPVAAPGATRPRDTQLPDAVHELVKEFQERLKANRALSEQLALRQPAQIARVYALTTDVKECFNELSVSIQKLGSQTGQLNEAMKEDLKCANTIQRAQSNPGFHGDEDFTASRLQDIALEHERLFVSLQNEVFELERQLARRHEASRGEAGGDAVSGQDLLAHLQKMKGAFYAIAAELYTVHEAVGNLKDMYIKYRRAAGDPISPFPDRQMERKGFAAGSPQKLFGPSPFEVQASAFGKLDADIISKASLNAPTTLQPTGISSFGQSGNLFSKPSFLGGTGTSIFAPAATTSSAVSIFSNPVSANSSSGTLFGGSATVPRPVGTTIPVLSVAPTQQSAAAASGAKRKS